MNLINMMGCASVKVSKCFSRYQVPLNCSTNCTVKSFNLIYTNLRCT